jgi:hypothetical protein
VQVAVQNLPKVPWPSGVRVISTVLAPGGSVSEPADHETAGRVELGMRRAIG